MCRKNMSKVVRRLRTDYYEPLVLFICHAKTSRLNEDKLEALGVLGVIIVRVRAMLEKLHGLTTEFKS